ncbi:glycosyltransferase family 4 protein [Rhodomicrobium vannielii ATCC 17100]|uniref:glycosyltransferase family 4 protein n=1 Tax=Rhodomicrobium vannielii TaxID=1069 RepID=UPI001919F539|nr:glycosyltransferase family 4 protein [Rhodomicrobium vannielii]MBJ7533326.1 glycosyltransferase family 4 protein [Rhodomicrobium vannielii ATCC 17100]
MMLKRSPWPVILQVVPELSTGGAERTAIEIAEAVTMGGGKALVISQGGRLEDELAAVGGELIRMSAATKNPALILANAMRIARLVRERGVSLVHARSRAPAWSAWIAARRAKRSFVTTYHGIYNQSGLVKAFYNGVMAKGDAVICNSEYTARIVRERHPKATSRVGVIYRGLDVDRFDPALISPERVRALREAWGVPPGKRIVLMPARLTRWKGQRVLVEAAALLSARNRDGDLVFVLVGDDQGRTPYRAELAALVEARGLADRVIIAGHCDDMPAAFNASWLTVIASIEAEAFGRVSVESQAMGCPVIASNIGALPETIAPEPGILANAGADGFSEPVPAAGQRPWLFEPGNPQALCDSISAALALDAAVLDAFRQHAMERARTSFSKRALQHQTLAVYDRLIGTQLAVNFANAASR